MLFEGSELLCHLSSVVCSLLRGLLSGEREQLSESQEGKSVLCTERSLGGRSTAHGLRRGERMRGSWMRAGARHEYAGGPLYSRLIVS